MKPNVKKLELAIVKASMRRYRRWKKTNGKVLPFGHEHALKDLDEWQIAKACERLHDARQARMRSSR